MHKSDVVMGNQVKRDRNTDQNMRNQFSSRGFEENEKDLLLKSVFTHTKRNGGVNWGAGVGVVGSISVPLLLVLLPRITRHDN